MISIPAAHALARLQATKALIETGTGQASIKLYASARVADTVDAGDALATMPIAYPCGTITDGVLNLAADGDGTVHSTGDALWCRIFNRAGALVASLDVRTIAEAAELGEVVVEQRTMYAGGIARLVSAALS